MGLDSWCAKQSPLTAFPLTNTCQGHRRGKDEDGTDMEGSFLNSSVMAGKVPQYVELLKFKVGSRQQAAA